MTPFHCELDVMRVQVPTVQNNKILETTCNEDLSRMQEPQIACPEIAATSLSFRSDVKGFSGCVRTVPVAFCHAGTGHPQLTHFIGPTFNERHRIHNHDLHVRKRSTASDQPTRIFGENVL